MARGCEVLISGVLLKCLADDDDKESGWELLQVSDYQGMSPDLNSNGVPKACIEAANESVLSGTKKISKKQEPEQTGIDLIVDSIIALLENSSSYTRALANQAFALITSEVKLSTIELILAVSLNCMSDYLKSF